MTPSVSFEFFPPKTVAACFKLWAAAEALAPFGPRFVSVTYGAGGSTRALTRDAAATLARTSGLTVAGHLTCVGATRDETLGVAESYAEAGVREIVALRGDPPKEAGGFTPHRDGFADSVELITALKEAGNFRIHVGAYPERHPDAVDEQADIDWLKRKFDAGADTAITQFFFLPETFFRFRDRAVRAGIDAERLIPGLLPIHNWERVRSFATACGASIPPQLDRGFAAAARDGRTTLYALAQATALAHALVEGGAKHLHLYTMNDAKMPSDICQAIGIEPKTALAAAA